jgi:hypothetical protein
MKKINLSGQITERSATVQRGSVYISPNLKRQSVMLDRNGNEIDPRTKRILKHNQEKDE